MALSNKSVSLEYDVIMGLAGTDQAALRGAAMRAIGQQSTCSRRRLIQGDQFSLGDSPFHRLLCAWGVMGDGKCI
jgi:hypothetical protein